MNGIVSQASIRLFLSTASTCVTSRHVATMAALLFGALLIFGAGFAGADVLHNAAHDGRHAFAFPCH